MALKPSPGEATGTIEAVLPRRSKFSRKVAGELTEEQIVAANIDTVFIVMGLDGDYNPRRLERYLVLTHESGANPVVILNKADIADHLPDDMDEIQALAVGIPVHAVSAKTGSGVEVIERYLGRGITGALLGSSGVGKSTLVNALVGEDMLKTKGRATIRAAATPRGIATWCAAANRGLLIDTAGMRELQLWTQPESARESFEDIETLAAGCHFTDCRHREEPRCAVKQAIEDGTLAAGRLENYVKLQDESQALEMRKNVREQINVKRKFKTVSQSMKKFYKDRE